MPIDLFLTHEIIEAYENNKLVIGKGYIEANGTRMEYGDLHAQAVSYVNGIIQNKYSDSAPERKMMMSECYIYDVKLIEEPTDLEKPYRVKLNDSEWHHRFKTLEEAKKMYYNCLKKMKRRDIKHRKRNRRS
jgi:hypothetical protein